MVNQKQKVICSARRYLLTTLLRSSLVASLRAGGTSSSSRLLKSTARSWSSSRVPARRATSLPLTCPTRTQRLVWKIKRRVTFSACRQSGSKLMHVLTGISETMRREQLLRLAARYCVASIPSPTNHNAQLPVQNTRACSGLPSLRIRVDLVTMGSRRD